MTGSTATVVAGLVIPSTSPLFLTGVGVHVAAALTCVVDGAAAMLSKKRRGRHSTLGTVYYWSLAVVFASAVGLSVVRWAEDYPLFLLAALSFAAATFGRTAMRRRWPGTARLHIAGMGVSYVVLLTAFYVDNGKSLPLWRDLPVLAYWLVPSMIGVPIMAYALSYHPLVRKGVPPLDTEIPM